MARLFGDLELCLALKAFLNGELNVGLPPVGDMYRSNLLKVMPTREEQLKEDNPISNEQRSIVEIPVNNLGQYFEGDDPNATLPLNYERVNCKGNLGWWHRVSIITKHCWESMGRPKLDVTKIVVKVDNEAIANPLGMLINLKIKVLGHRIRHTFIIMKFSKKPTTYEMILGKPFMREAQMVHERSKNHVYLQFHDSIIQVDLLTGQVHPLGSREIFENCSDTIVHSAPLKYCYTCKEDTNVRSDSPYLNVLPRMDTSHDANQVHLAPTIDTQGNRGTTWVTPKGEKALTLVPLNMIHATNKPLADTINSEDESSKQEEYETCRDGDIDIEPKLKQQIQGPTLQVKPHFHLNHGMQSLTLKI